AVARRARQGVVDARVTLVRRRVADRAGLNERLTGTARAVPVRDAAQIRVRPARARAGLAYARVGTVGVAAARRIDRILRTAAAGIVDARPAARAGHGRAAATAARAVRPRGRPARAPHRHEVTGQEDARAERQIEVVGASGV